MELGRLVGQEPDLVDRKRLDAVVFPVVRISPQLRLGQQGRGEGAGRGRLAEPGLSHEQIRMRQPAACQLGAQLRQGLRVPDDAREWVRHPDQVSVDKLSR